MKRRSRSENMQKSCLFLLADIFWEIHMLHVQRFVAFFILIVFFGRG